MEIVKAFLASGLLCLLGQLLFVNTRLGFVKVFMVCISLGVILTALGLMNSVVGFGGAGIIVSVTDAGEALYNGFAALTGGNGAKPILLFAALMAGVFISGLAGGVIGGLRGKDKNRIDS